jgi:hypothetical protein
VTALPKRRAALTPPSWCAIRTGSGPRGKSWSLDRTYTSTASLLQKCLDRDAPSASRATPAQRLAVGIVVGFGYILPGAQRLRVPCPSGSPAEEVVRDLPAHIAEMEGVLRECEHRFGAGRKLANHFVLGPLSADQWRKFHWVHTRHHLKQIARLRGM